MQIRRYYAFYLLLFLINSNQAMFTTAARRTATISAPLRTPVRTTPSLARRWFTSFEEFLFGTESTEQLTKRIKEIHTSKKPLSPTQAHLAYYLGPQIARNQMAPLDYWNFRGLEGTDIDQLDVILEKEKEYISKDYTVLYHSTQPSLYALNYIATKLAQLHAELIEQKPIPKKVPLLLRYEPIGNADTRQQFLTGSPNDHRDRNYLLSCNPSLTSNISTPGECTLKYWALKNNVFILNDIDGRIKSLIEQQYTIFKDYINLDALYKAKQHLDEQLFTGILLQLVFKSHELVEQCSYISQALGIRHSVCTKVDNKRVTSPQELVKLLSKQPDTLTAQDIDAVQIRVILTQDKLLDVLNNDIASAFEINAFANPQAALEAFNKEVNAIMQQAKEAFMHDVQANKISVPSPTSVMKEGFSADFAPAYRLMEE